MFLHAGFDDANKPFMRWPASRKRICVVGTHFGVALVWSSFTTTKPGQPCFKQRSPIAVSSIPVHGVLAPRLAVQDDHHAGVEE